MVVWTRENRQWSICMLTSMGAIRYVIPNLFTGLSFCLGLGSVLASHSGDLELAGWLIVWCALLDIADGAAARMLNAASRFGAEFDSLADLTAFGIAPSALAFAAGTASPGLLIAAGVFFALTAALRLARFNAGEPEQRASWFRGVPTTLAGSIVATAILTTLRQPSAAPPDWGWALPVVLTALGLAMISPLRFPKIVIRQSRALNFLQLAILASVYLCGILRLAPAYLLGISVGFAVIGIAIGLFAAGPDRR